MRSYWDEFVLPLHSSLHRIVSFFPRLLVAASLFLVLYLVSVLARRIVFKSLGKLPGTPWVVQVLIARLIYILLIFLAIILALSAANVDVTTVVASLGVAGVAVGFALKDIIENFISGILLLFARPFALGDQVKLGDYEGVVTDIQIRATTVRTYSNELVVIPNAKVYSNPIVNQTSLGHRRYEVAFDTSLKVEIDHIEQIMLDVAAKLPDALTDPAPVVRIKSIESAADTIHWRIYFSGPPGKGSESAMISQCLDMLKTALFEKGVPAPSIAPGPMVR
jgi:small-conductance mechanosensitive channel